ncbi:hypothetical protein [Rhizobium binxianense]
MISHRSFRYTFHSTGIIEAMTDSRMILMMKISHEKPWHGPSRRWTARLLHLWKRLNPNHRGCDRPASAADITPHLKRDIGIHDDGNVGGSSPMDDARV